MNNHTTHIVLRNCKIY